MKGIYFDSIHSYENLNLVLSGISIPPAAVKTTFVDIPGADGSIDLTEALGEVRYKDRECAFTFTVFPYEDFEEKKKQISNLLNGKRCKIKLDKDPGYYWIGRCSVKDYASNKNLHQITVGAKVLPYKWKANKTVITAHFCSKNLFDGTMRTVAFTTGGRIITGNSGYIGFWLPIQPGETYTVSRGAVASNRFSVAFTTEEPVTNLLTYNRIDNAEGLSITVTAPLDCKYLVCYLSNQGDSVTDTHYQVEVGDTATEYEAYTPSTDPVNVTLTNGRKSVVPTIICTGEVTITLDGSEYELNEGTHKVLDIQLLEGETAMTLTGSGSVCFVYQEGDL